MRERERERMSERERERMSERNRMRERERLTWTNNFSKAYMPSLVIWMQW